MERDTSPPPSGTPGAPAGASPFEERYTGLREIGRGASSVVHRAWSPEFARDVAIKVFHTGIAEDDDLRRRFRRECRALGTLTDHPHVVSVFDSGFTPSGQPYLVMAYCAGGSFGRRLAEFGPLPPAEVAVVGIALADALAAAHAHGIVHRDVKPHNVLLTAYGVVALADFGVAGGGGGFDLRSFAATPGYAAPELVAGSGGTGVGNPAADLYALGATLYALLTGGPPHRQRPEEADVAYLMRAAAEPPPPLGPSVPAALAAVVASCLAPEPAARPADAVTLRHRLRLAAAADGLELPERIDVVPLASATAGPDAATWVPSPGLGMPSFATRTSPPAGALWPRRLAVAGLAAGLVAAGVAGGAWLRPPADGGEAVLVPGPSVTVTSPPPTGAADAPAQQAAAKPDRSRPAKRKAEKSSAGPARPGPAEDGKKKDDSGKGKGGPAPGKTDKSGKG
jgi:hypothetical protein